MAREFNIKDINELIKELDKKGLNIKKGIKKGVIKTTYNCQSMAKRNAPVDKGHLRAGIFVKIKEESGAISGMVEPLEEYSVYPEFGTGQRGMASKIERSEGIHYSADWKGQDAQPYMYPAYLNQREKLLPNIKKELDKILKGAK